MSSNDYRPCVVGVFTNNEGEVFVCERTDTVGAWQFPQGGIDNGETRDQAICREMKEELGVDKIKLVQNSGRYINYDFPKSATSDISKKYRGQKQIWYELKFLENDPADLSKATDKEFISIKWTSVTEILDCIISWKKNAYLEGLRQLSIID